jgi:hypothetical protein
MSNLKPKHICSAELLLHNQAHTTLFCCSCGGLPPLPPSNQKTLPKDTPTGNVRSTGGSTGRRLTCGMEPTILMRCGALYSRKMDTSAMDRMVTVSGPIARTQPKRLRSQC